MASSIAGLALIGDHLHGLRSCSAPASRMFRMKEAVSPEVLLRGAADRQASLPLAAEGVARWIWEGRFGSMLIEVVGDHVFVNGDLVRPHQGSTPPAEGTHGAPDGAAARGNPDRGFSHTG